MIEKTRQENTEQTHRRRGGAFDNLASFLRNIKMITFGTGSIIQDRPGVTSAEDLEDDSTFVKSKSIWELYQKETDPNFFNLIYIGRQGKGRNRNTNYIEITADHKDNEGLVGNGQILIKLSRNGNVYPNAKISLYEGVSAGLEHGARIELTGEGDGGGVQLTYFDDAGNVSSAFILDKDGVQLIGSTPNYGNDTGSANTYILTLPSILSYITGMEVTFKAKTANTGASTLNINGLGPKSIIKRASTALASGDIATGMICKVVYDGTNFSLMNPVED